MRLAEDTGGSRGRSSSRSNSFSRLSWTSKSLKGKLETVDDEIKLAVEETSNNEQSLKLADNEDTTRLIFRSPTAFVQILRIAEGVHVCSGIEHETVSWTGHSFSEIVQQHEDYFRNTLQPLLKDAVHLPLDEAMAAEKRESDTPVVFPAIEFAAGPLADGAVAEAFAAVMRFRVVDGQLRINRFFGDRAILEKEIQRVSGEFQDSLNRSIERLKSQDATIAMINELQEKLGWKMKADQNAANPPAFRGGFDFGGLNPFAPADQTDQLRTSFHRLQNSVSGGGSSSYGGGGGRCSASFSSGEISASIGHSRGTTNLSAQDSEAQFSIRETESLFELLIESDTGLLVITDVDDQSCSVLLLGGGECHYLQADSLAAPINNHEDVYRDRILPILNRYHISGMDPLATDVVAAILKRLPTIEAGELKLDTVVGETDAYVVPLLNDADYLKILATRLEGDEAAAIANRADSLLAP